MAVELTSSQLHSKRKLMHNRWRSRRIGKHFRVKVSVELSENHYKNGNFAEHSNAQAISTRANISIRFGVILPILHRIQTKFLGLFLKTCQDPIPVVVFLAVAAYLDSLEDLDTGAASIVKN